MADNKIFVSYRRQDASGEAGRLVDYLQEIYGDESVFLDVETIEAGLDFVQAIDKALNSCKILIAIIGPHWVNIQDPEGKPRLFHEGDFIRIEISAALKRDIRVIPVLVNGAIMPSPEQLPEDLQALTRRHAHELSSSRWKYDCDQLVLVLNKIIEPKPMPKPIKPKPVPPKKSWLATNYLWFLAGFVGLIVIILILDTPDDAYQDPYQEPIGLAEDTEDESQSNVISAEDLNEIRENNPEGSEVYDQLKGSESAVPENSIEDISGYWLLADPDGNTSTLVFEQYQNSFEFIEYNVFNVEVGEGTGSISGNQLTSDYYNSMVQINGKLKLTSADNGASWSGTISFPTLGTSTAISIQRITP
ncbi:toll/interleukin-1 receptor domain-containing protein [Algoriphagus aestuarii]|nr:toll/interleukin-1 receptor domain-containing protein [Algoriphagus aestuarii]